MQLWLTAVSAAFTEGAAAALVLIRVAAVMVAEGLAIPVRGRCFQNPGQHADSLILVHTWWRPNMAL